MLKYPLFSSLYFSQGIIYSLTTVILPVYFLEKNIPIPVITTVIGIAYIPWIAKFFFGGITDYFAYLGRRKFIISGGILSALSFFIVSILDPEIALIPFTIFLFIASSGIAFLDVSADAWAIQTSEEKERGKINGVMFGGMFLGTIFGSSIIAIIAGSVGYQYTFITAAVIFLLVTLFPLSVKERVIIDKRQKIGSLLIREFKEKSTQVASIFAPFTAISYGILGVILPIYMSTVLKLDITQIGLIMSIGMSTTFVGSIIGGFIVDRWGRKKILYFFFGASMIVAALLIYSNSWEILALLWSMIGFFHGVHYCAIGALFMDLTNPKIGAVQFSLFMSFGNMGEMGGTTLSGLLVSTLGYNRVFLYSAWAYGPALLLLYFIKQKKGEKK